ncbi:MAG: hypothetical protein Fur0010_06360 [Bdellovibrio sp.]
MAFGLLGVSYQSKVLPYHDEKTPIELTGIKMLPIVQEDSGLAMNESLEIIKKFDSKGKLNFTHYQSLSTEIDHLLDRIASPVHNLAMPYWIWTKEFNDQSREYFEAKKSKKRGPFNKLVHRRDEFISQLSPIFEDLNKQLTLFYKSQDLTIVDIMIAAHLWGLYVVPEFQFPQTIHDYLQAVKKLTHFNYHEDFWRDQLKE